MGNRILKESIILSNEINELSYFEETLFYRLIVSVDDYGVYLANRQILAHTLYPGKCDVSEEMIRAALEHMEELNLVQLYHVEGKGDFLYLVTWNKHQTQRLRRHKYPMPEAEDEAQAETQQPEEPWGTVVRLPLNDGTDYCVNRADVNDYAKLYPAVDVEQELKCMRGWCLANPEKRKTRGGITKFIINWLRNQQDEAGKKETSGNSEL